MQAKGIVLLALILLSVLLSGCMEKIPGLTNSSIPGSDISAEYPFGHKVPPIVDNHTLTIIDMSWIRPSNVSIIDSSATVTHLQFHENTNVTDETIQFNATDGKTHTSNLTIYMQDQGTTVLDVDGGSVTHF